MKFKHSDYSQAFKLKNSKLYVCVFSNIFSQQAITTTAGQKLLKQQLIHLKQRLHLGDIIFARILHGLM